MKTIISTTTLVVFMGIPLLAEDKSLKESDAPQGDNWIKVLTDRSKRRTLHGAFQKVRGDSGKWNDDPKLQHAPPLARKPAKMSLDDWYDLLERTRRRPLTSADENWLLFKTKQFDDNDRVWVERIERHGHRFTVTLNQAIWQGRYQKSFTFYNVFGINLGKLAPGNYEVQWIIAPLVFKQFEGNGRPLDEQRRDNWPKDEQPSDAKPVELPLTFTIVAQ